MLSIKRIKNILIQHDFHYLLLLLFFCLNGFRMFRDLVALDSLFVFFISVAISFLFLSFLLKKIISDQSCVGIVLLYFMFLFLFFGNIEDGFAGMEALVYLSEPLYFIPFILFVSVVVVVLILKIKSLVLFRSFVNAVLLIWVITELGMIFFLRDNAAAMKVDEVQILPVADQNKYPVYYVVLDEYGGDSTLLTGFGHNNTPFKKRMNELGFRDVKNSSANYPLTVHSLSSTMDMDYLPDRVLTNSYAFGYKYGLTRIRENRVASVFSSWGYRINNFSFFDFEKAPADFSNSIWGGGARALTARCMHIRLYKHLISFSHRYHFGFLENMERDHHYDQINYSLRSTAEDAGKKKDPSFNFIHILSPHKPFLFDSVGNKLNYDRSTSGSFFSDKEAYTWSVKKINLLISDWSETIIKAHQGNVVIMIMSDHGPSIGEGKGRSLDNLNLIYVPGKKDGGWYDGMSNVNQFRVLFNTVFGQQFPILKDRLVPVVPGGMQHD